MSHIMIIDDDPHQLIMFKAMLTPLGFDLSLYTSAEDALNDIFEVNPDLILLDLALPRMNGLRFVEEIQQYEELRKIPIAAISAQYTTFTPHQCEHFGLEIFFRKPVSGQELRDGILQCLS